MAGTGTGAGGWGGAGGRRGARRRPARAPRARRAPRPHSAPTRALAQALRWALRGSRARAGRVRARRPCARAIAPSTKRMQLGYGRRTPLLAWRRSEVTPSISLSLAEDTPPTPSISLSSTPRASACRVRAHARQRAVCRRSRARVGARARRSTGAAPRAARRGLRGEGSAGRLQPGEGVRMGGEGVVVDGRWWWMAASHQGRWWTGRGEGCSADCRLLAPLPNTPAPFTPPFPSPL
jgi:hypothetical protein